MNFTKRGSQVKAGVEAGELNERVEQETGAARQTWEYEGIDVKSSVT